MNAGKRKCELLKSIRKEIAEKYNLQYTPVECTYEGDCLGTCPMCDAELKDLQRQLDEKGVVDVDLMKGEDVGEMVGEDDIISVVSEGVVLEGEVVPEYFELLKDFKPSNYEKKVKKRVLFKGCFVAGVGFRDVDWDEMDEGIELKLVRHKENKYDKNAVAVVLADDYDEEDDDFDFDFILGYIPRTENAEIAKMLDMGWGEMFECEISRVKRYGPMNERVKIAIYVKSKDENMKMDTRHLLRVKELDRKEYSEFVSDINRDGMIHFRFGGYPPFELNLPKEGDKVVFLHRREKDVVVYLMHTIAVGDEHASNFLGVLERWIDDCTYFVFTNIKGPIVVASEKIAFLSLEGLDFRQPEQFISELASVRLWDLFEI